MGVPTEYVFSNTEIGEFKNTEIFWEGSKFIIGIALTIRIEEGDLPSSMKHPNVKCQVS